MKFNQKLPLVVGFALAIATSIYAEEHEHGHVDEVKLTAEAIRVANIKIEPATKQVLTPTFDAPARVAAL